MEVEYTTKMIPVGDPEVYKTEMEKLGKEGWMLVPGVQPVAIYSLVRQKNVPANPPTVAAGATPVLTIDDSKIFMIRADGKQN